MAKRYIDTGLWSKRWFRELPVPGKAAWFYILTNCDPVGVWDSDLKLANFCIGLDVDWDGLRAAANGNIEVLENGKWWVVDFCSYQYGKLDREADSGVRKSLVLLLFRHSLWDKYVCTLPESDTESASESDTGSKDKEKEDSLVPSSSKKRKSSKSVGEKVHYDFSSHLWYGIDDALVALWQEAYPAVDVELELRQMGIWCEANPDKGHKSRWKRFIVNWLKRSQDRGGSVAKGEGGWKKKQYSR
jgi:hypothetical protein